MKKILLDTLNSKKQEYIDYLKELVSIKKDRNILKNLQIT